VSGGLPTEKSLLLFESTLENGEIERTFLIRSLRGLELCVGDGPGLPLPANAVEIVMRRYGKPLANEVVVDGPGFPLGDGCALKRLRFLPRFDVIARDYLVLCAPDSEPLTELATAVTAALLHLARRLPQ